MPRIRQQCPEIDDPASTDTSLYTVPLMNIFTLTSFSHLATQLKSWQVKFEDHERFSFGGMEASM